MSAAPGQQTLIKYFIYLINNAANIKAQLFRIIMGGGISTNCQVMSAVYRQLAHLAAELAASSF